MLSKSMPREFQVLQRFAPAFTRPTFERFILLCVGAIVALGRRTVSRILWSIRALVDGHSSSYHRVLSRRRVLPWVLGRVLCAMVLELLPADQPVVIEIDDTTDGPHPGRKVYASACHRDAVRSSRKHTAFKWGHKWIVLAINVRFPFASRPWALPVLCALYRKRKLNRKEDRRHKTPCELGRGLLARLIHWFPERHFICLGDGGFASHDLAWFCHKHRKHVTLIARGRRDLNLHALPPRKRPRGRRGPTPRKGRKLPSPADTVAHAKPWRCRLAWYGNAVREVELFSACGGWYRAQGHGYSALIPIRWVYVHDLLKGREDWFYSTDPTMDPKVLVESFAGRWNIEVTFEEARAHLGLGTSRQRVANSVLRMAPWLLGLFTVVSLVYAQLTRKTKPHPHGTPCYKKTTVTFGDALAAVRELLWREVILKQVDQQGLVAKLPPPLRHTLLDHLILAA
jgi:hypothetical protein